MAGDWIKMRSALLSNPKVHTIARLVGECRAASRVLTTGANCEPRDVLSRNALRNVTVTALLIVWSSANEHTNDGVMRCCDLFDIDEIAGIPGFGEAMEEVGWAQYNQQENAVILPNFTEWNTPAKDRTAAERQRRYRQKRNGNVTRDSNGREEKRREENKEEDPPLPPKGETDERKSSGKKLKEEPIAFPAEVHGACQDWLEFKRQNGKRYKPRGMKAFVTQVENALKSHGAAAVKAAMQQAMANNYQGWTFLLDKPAGGSGGKTWAQQSQSNVQQLLAKAAADDAAALMAGGLAGFIGGVDGK